MPCGTEPAYGSGATCRCRMAGAFLSADWYRIADLRLERRPHLDMARHVYRDVPWHVLQDPQNGKFHRLTPQSHAFFARLDGRRTVQEIWESCCLLFPDDPPSQSDILRFVAQLHTADLVAGDRRPNLTEIDRRAREEEVKTLFSYVKNPLSLRFPLVDPEPLLRSLAWLARLVFSPIGAVVWVALVVSALATLVLNADRLSLPRADQIASAADIVYLGIAYIVVKAVHELGHGLAVKRWGGEVRELGVMFLVFFPMPYVDASQATFFPSKYQRMAVSAAGILVEIALASIALFVWLQAEPGPVRTLAFNVMLIGGVSTILFNGNPLLRFDGYFVLADGVDSPNLAQRSNQYFWFNVQRHLLRYREAQAPIIGPREGPLLFFYAVASFFYRMMVMLIISLYIAAVLPVVGVLLVAWSLFTVFIMPIWKGAKFLMTDPGLDIRRPMYLLRAAAIIGACTGFVMLVPLPQYTNAYAVYDPGESAAVRVAGQGQVEELLVRNGDAVTAGQPILRLSDPLLSLERLLAEAEMQDARLKLGAIPITDANARRLWREQISFAEARLAELDDRESNLLLHAPRNGIIVLPDQHVLGGTFLRRGQTIGELLEPGAGQWRTAVPAGRAELVDSDLQGVVLRPMAQTAQIWPARITARGGEVTTRLASFGLAKKGGGLLIADPSEEAPTSLAPVVSYMLQPDAGVADPLQRIGARAAVRFEHSAAPLGPRLWRVARQTFLATFLN